MTLERFELDFSGLHINIAYALEGLDPIQEDPYSVDTMIQRVSTEEQRGWVKSLSLMALNARNDEQSSIHGLSGLTSPLAPVAKRSD
jgi:hypothetical protein